MNMKAIIGVALAIVAFTLGYKVGGDVYTHFLRPTTTTGA